MIVRTALTTGVLVVLLIALSSNAVAQQAVGDDHPDPVNRAENRGRVAIPCDQALATVDLGVGEFVTFADTTAGEGVVDSYGCRDWNESGPEHIYLLEIGEELDVDIWLADNEPDHDLVLLSDCDSDSCLAQANTQISARLPAGSYVLVVDGYEALADTVGAAGPYELTIESRAVGVPQEICEPGGAVDLGEFDGSEENGAFVGTLYEQPNLVSIFDCAPFAVRGGEVWYQATLAAADTTYDDGTDLGSVKLEVTVAADSLDVVIWIFDGCGPEAQCLEFIDEGPGGAEETVSWLNLEQEPVTIYLAVDSAVPAISGTQGEYEIDILSAVPTRRHSLSDVRSLFR